MDWMGHWCDGGGMEGLSLVGYGTGVPPLAPEREPNHSLLRGGGRWEAVAGTNYVGAARARSIFVGAAK